MRQFNGVYPISGEDLTARPVAASAVTATQNGCTPA
jgi:hypothetical protein